MDRGDLTRLDGSWDVGSFTTKEGPTPDAHRSPPLGFPHSTSTCLLSLTAGSYRSRGLPVLSILVSLALSICLAHVGSAQMQCIE